MTSQANEPDAASSAPAASLSTVLQENIARIKNDFGNSSDLTVNFVEYDRRPDIGCADIYIEGMADSGVLNNLSSELLKMKSGQRSLKPRDFFSALKNTFANLRASKEGADFTALYQELLSGNVVFLVDGCGTFLSVSAGSAEGRAISEPTSQTIIKGPKDAFTEEADKNVRLIRKRIRNEALRIEDLTAGSVSRTRVKLMYISGIAKDEIIKDIRDRINKIDNDAILDSGYIEEFVKTDRYSVFPTILNSEKPDAVSGALLEGRIAILVDGTPYVSTAPALLFDFISSGEDYYNHFFVSSLMRIVRYMALLLTLFVPALYIAITTFHQEIIPTPLLISFAAQREGVPFPAFLEVLIMETTFEIIREAGIRMPRAIGPAISIVGALVLGQAAVEAGLVSAGVVIVVAVTAISSFAITNYGLSNAIRLMRFALIFVSGILGLYGISIGFIIIVVHLCKLKSAGVPYLSSIAPSIKGQKKDIFIRAPLWTLTSRPFGISKTNAARTSSKSVVDPNSDTKQELK